VEIFPEKKRGKGGPWLAVDFGEGVGVVNYHGGHLAHLVLSYCGTIHAVQGGQGPAVVIALVDQHYVMLTRTLLYTAITRAQHACIVVGSRRAVETAAKNARDDARRTALPRMLTGMTSRGEVGSGTETRRAR
jgi:exodeoxyribonuclease V alpha subunit